MWTSYSFDKHKYRNGDHLHEEKDLILAGAVLLLAGLLALGTVSAGNRKTEILIKVTVDGEVYGTYALSRKSDRDQLRPATEPTSPGD
ncbi:MAG: hypothetical protein ACLUYY_09345 [Blautia sp.]